MNIKELETAIIRVIEAVGVETYEDEPLKPESFQWAELGSWLDTAYRISAEVDDPDELRMGPHPYEYIEEVLRPEMAKAVARMGAKLPKSQRPPSAEDLLAEDFPAETLGRLMDTMRDRKRAAQKSNRPFLVG